MVLQTVREILLILTRRDRRNIGLLLILALVSAGVQVAGVAAVLPFLAVAADPSQVQDNVWLASAYHFLGFSSTKNFLVALGIGSLLLLVAGNAFMAATAWMQIRFCMGCVHSLGMRTLERYAAEPYEFYLNRNSADLTKNVMTEVDQVSTGVIMPALEIIARTIVAIAIIGLLVAIDPGLAAIVVVFLGGAYAAVYLVVRRTLTTLGNERLIANTARFKSLNEFFGAIKEVKLLGKESAFVRQFSGPSARYCRNRATANIIGQLPRYLLEILAFGGIILIALYLLNRGDAIQRVIPILGIYAFAGYRLMPNLQQIFSACTTITFNRPALSNLSSELAEESTISPATKKCEPVSGCVSKQDPINSARIDLDNITFTYLGAAKPSISDMTLTIEPNTSVGIVGKTGAGKTTLIDILLGLLQSQAGELRVDGIPITKANLPHWQSRLGYVPQHIYLTDDTIAGNIAFGIRPMEIDMAAVRNAARIASIDEFVTRELPKGYETVVGENGVRLSGGQRQRIGIARALYHNPDVLVFDEATSALDTATETVVMEAMRKLAGTRTLIIVAHRLTTVQTCDAIYTLEAGRLHGGCSGALTKDTVA